LLWLLHTSTSCVFGSANPSDNWNAVPNTLNRSLGSDRGEAGDILGDDIPGDANRVACNLGDVMLAECGPVHDRLREVEFQVVSQRPVVSFPVAGLREVSRRQVVFVQGVRSQVAGSVDCLLQARQEVARRSEDDSSKNHPLRHRLLASYSDDQGRRIFLSRPDSVCLPQQGGRLTVHPLRVCVPVPMVWSPAQLACVLVPMAWLLVQLACVPVPMACVQAPMACVQAPMVGQRKVIGRHRDRRGFRHLHAARKRLHKSRTLPAAELNNKRFVLSCVSCLCHQMN
jgi:hypothetical protein